MLRRGVDSVTCIACGTSVDEADAYEYHKHGDHTDDHSGDHADDARHDHAGDPPEYLCAACFDDLSPGDRDGLEQLLCGLQAGDVTTREFLTRYADAVQESET
ncbi:DUF7562 family protein [Halocalculus aciditolerans]|uniref:C2H2-type domain-containing protein n=1 Tax=Halocalculus aciditolerans TaxID=1383812 RepID=A0A830FNB1_9EURY|nr:hypothetical protein [Halocalculus aciditolerans]GGL69863.1 hypothetical protein GCM10009039_29860 [Halocalculus aciditolerans]